MSSLVLCSFLFIELLVFDRTKMLPFYKLVAPHGKWSHSLPLTKFPMLPKTSSTSIRDPWHMRQPLPIKGHAWPEPFCPFFFLHYLVPAIKPCPWM
jgi:hypothetical protein